MKQASSDIHVSEMCISHCIITWSAVGPPIRCLFYLLKVDKNRIALQQNYAIFLSTEVDKSMLLNAMPRKYGPNQLN